MCYISFNKSQMCSTTSKSITSWTSSVVWFPLSTRRSRSYVSLYVRDNYSKPTEVFKAYILVFTCATTQCTRLQLVTDVTTETLILAIKRFISQRGKPYFFISDNFKALISKGLKRFLLKVEIYFVEIYFRKIPIVRGLLWAYHRYY